MWNMCSESPTSPPSRRKRIVKTAVQDYASNKLPEEATTNSNLRYLAPYHIHRIPHSCLSNVLEH